MWHDWIPPWNLAWCFRKHNASLRKTAWLKVVSANFHKTGLCFCCLSLECILTGFVVRQITLWRGSATFPQEEGFCEDPASFPGQFSEKQRGKKTWHSCLYLMAHHLVLWFSWLNSATTCSNYTRNLKSTVETCWNQERSLKLWIIWFDGAQVLIKITLESRHSWLSVALFKASLQTFPHPQTHRSKTNRIKWCPAASSVVHWCKILPGIGLS